MGTDTVMKSETKPLERDTLFHTDTPTWKQSSNIQKFTPLGTSLGNECDWLTYLLTKWSCLAIPNTRRYRTDENLLSYMYCLTRRPLTKNQVFPSPIWALISLFSLKTSHNDMKRIELLQPSPVSPRADPNRNLQSARPHRVSVCSKGPIKGKMRGPLTCP